MTVRRLPRFAAAVSVARQARVLDALRGRAAWFRPTERVTDRGHAEDNNPLGFALAVDVIVSGDANLLTLHPGAECASYSRWRAPRRLGMGG